MLFTASQTIVENLLGDLPELSIHLPSFVLSNEFQFEFVGELHI